MFNRSSKQMLLGIFIALFFITTPVYSVTNYKISNYGGGHQIWFEVEDYDDEQDDEDHQDEEEEDEDDDDDDDDQEIDDQKCIEYPTLTHQHSKEPRDDTTSMEEYGLHSYDN